MSCNRQFYEARLAATELQILALETALEAILVQGVQSYTLDTGQSRQVVTRYDVRSMEKTLDGLYNRHATLCARLHGSTTIARPAF